jgi:type IV pilus assembly protein PilA
MKSHVHSISPEKNRARGFTLIEVLLVVAIIAILAGITIVAINPARQYDQAKNSERISHVNTILNAVHQYALDNGGVLPASIPVGDTCTGDAAYEICQTGASCASGVDLSPLTASEVYLVSIPIDPEESGSTGTGYNIVQSTNGRITVCAPAADLSQDISVKR